MKAFVGVDGFDWFTHLSVLRPLKIETLESESNG